MTETPKIVVVDDDPPQLGRPKLPASVTAVPVNNPPFGAFARRAGAIMATIVAVSTQPAYEPWQYDYGGGRQPYDGARKLPCSVTAVPVNNPPFTHQGRSAVEQQVAVSAAQPDPWQYNYQGSALGRQPYGSRQLPPAITAVPVNNPPFSSRPTWQPAVLTAWQPPDPQPTQANKLNPSITTVVVNEPPYSHGGRSVSEQLIVAAAQPDPWQYNYQGSATGRQPYGARQLPPAITAVPVNNPPLGHAGRSGWVQEVIASWQPPHPPPIVPRNVIPPSVDNPPPRQPTILFLPRPDVPQPARTYVPIPPVVATVQSPYAPAWLATVIQAWQPPDPPPVQRGPLNPSILAVPVNTPSGVGVPKVIAVEDDPLPQLGTKIAAAIAPPPPVVNNPPFGPRIFIGWTDGTPLIFPQTSGQQVLSVDNPPFSYQGRNSWVPSVVASWQPPDPQPQQKGTYLTGSAPPPVVNNPPFSHPGRWVQTITVALWWQPPDPQPVQKGPLNPSITAVEVDNPPSIGVPKIVTVDDDPLPTLSRKLPPSVLAVSADNPPFSHPGRSVQAIEVVYSWQPPDPQPTQPTPHVTASGVAVVVQGPYVNTWLATVLAAWQPADPQPTQANKLNPSITAVPVNNPPFQHMGRWPQAVTVRFAWEPPDPQPTQRGPLNPSVLAVEVDNPPFTNFGRTPNFFSIMSWWTIPPDPQPQKGVINPNIPPPPTPTGQGIQFTVSSIQVNDQFGPTTGVSHTWAGVNKRTV